MRACQTCQTYVQTDLTDFWRLTFDFTIVILRSQKATYGTRLWSWESWPLNIRILCVNGKAITSSWVTLRMVLFHTSKFFTGCFCVFVTEIFQNQIKSQHRNVTSVSRIFCILSFGRRSKLAASMGHSWSCFHDSLIEKPSLYLPTLSPFLRGRSSFSRNLYPIILNWRSTYSRKTRKRHTHHHLWILST